MWPREPQMKILWKRTFVKFTDSKTITFFFFVESKMQAYEFPHTQMRICCRKCSLLPEVLRGSLIKATRRHAVTKNPLVSSTSSIFKQNFRASPTMHENGAVARTTGIGLRGNPSFCHVRTPNEMTSTRSPWHLSRSSRECERKWQMSLPKYKLWRRGHGI